MKEDKQKQQNAAPDENALHQKVEKLMGPPPEQREAGTKAQDFEVQQETPKEAEPIEPVKKAEKPAKEQPKEEPVPEPQESLDRQEGEGFLDDAELDKAVDDIAHQESDDLLKEEDAAVQKAWDANEDKRSLGQKIKDFFKAWWRNPKARKTTIATVIFAILLLAVVPTTRYFFLNLVGVRSSASIKVLDQGTGLPLKNVNVYINNQSSTTDEEGLAQLQGVKLGKTNLKIERRAFAVVEKPITVGWGSNPLGEQSLEPVGLQYSFKTVDFLSGKPIENTEAYSGDASAFSNGDGEIVLTLDTTSDEAVEIMITADGYRTEKVTETANNDKVQEIKMAPANKHVFVSKRSGKFDVYKIDADGKNEELILAGTGTERDDIVVAAHPERNVAALVSTREGVRNSDGYLLSTLTLIDLETNETTSLGRSERFQVVGWSGDRIVYVQIASGASTSNPERHKLLSYDYVNDEQTALASSNYFNDVMLAQNKVYYAPSAAYQDEENVGMFVVDPDGQNQKTILENETWNVFRTDYDTLTIAVGRIWYEYKIGGEEGPSALNGAPAEPVSRMYIDGPDGVSSFWIDQRDGKGVLLRYDKQNQEDTVLVSQSGLSNPVRWLNSTTAAYRVHTEDETADYIVSLETKEPQKLIDVTDTSGVENWYYY
jgi:hypothetical protein